MKDQLKVYQMKKNRRFTLLMAVMFIVCTVIFNKNVDAQVKIELSDIEVLNNTNWQGNLMYVDYSSGKKTVLQTKMQLTIKGNVILMSTQYDNEPKANSKGSIKLKKGGTYFGNEKVIEKTKLENDILKIVTISKGSDNNKKATFYKTYLFNENMYSVTKEVLLTGSEEKFIRNKYTYTKI